MFKSLYLVCIGCRWCLSFSFHMDMNMNLMLFPFRIFHIRFSLLLSHFELHSDVPYYHINLPSSDCAMPAIRYNRSIVSSPWHTIWLNNLVSNVITTYYILFDFCKTWFIVFLCISFSFFPPIDRCPFLMCMSWFGSFERINRLIVIILFLFLRC